MIHCTEHLDFRHCTLLVINDPSIRKNGQIANLLMFFFCFFHNFFRLMADLTTPLECLFANMEGASEEGTYAIYELKQHLSDIKTVFLDPKIAKTVLTHMTRLLEKG